MLWVELAQAVTTAMFGSFSAETDRYVSGRPLFVIIIGTMKGLTRLGPFS